jgi:serine phosphatase RsbU (regulator of sigma subunit)
VTTADPTADGRETAVRTRTAVSFYVAGTLVLAAACMAATAVRQGTSFPADLVAFLALAALTDLREIKLPVVGIVTLSFVPVLASLVVFGLWQALLVATASALATAWFTRDVEKILFNVGNYIVSTFLAGVVYLALVPHGAGLGTKVLPLFAATAVDFFVNTIVLAGVLSLATQESAMKIWRRNYQWGLPSYLTGASLSLLVTWLYVQLHIPGLILGLPPLYLIYYSYDIYVSRARDREQFGEQIASFRQELQVSETLHDQLRSAQLKVAAEMDRARRIQLDLLPTVAPSVEGLELAQRIEFLGEMGGDYYDFLSYPDGRVGIVCADVMGKGLAAALIMAMARSLLHSAIATRHSPGAVLAEVNDGLARDLQGQRLPYFLTLTLAVYDPAGGEIIVAGGGHNPTLVSGPDGVRSVPSRGAVLGVRTGMQYPEDRIAACPGDLIAFYTDGLTEARSPDGELYGVDRLSGVLNACREHPLAETLDAMWNEITAFRDGGPPTDDATLLLARLT